jgi:hypothetical protein
MLPVEVAKDAHIAAAAHALASTFDWSTGQACNVYGNVSNRMFATAYFRSLTQCQK